LAGDEHGCDLLGLLEARHVRVLRGPQTDLLERAALVLKSSIGCNIKWKRGNAPDYF
jgi:hypothetical protein